MPGDEIDTDSKPRQPVFWGHRQQVAALIVGHLALTALVSAVNSWPRDYYGDYWFVYLTQLVQAGLFGVQMGQIVLVAFWGAFANQGVLSRFVRFQALIAWMLLVGFLGGFLVEGGRAIFLVEEQFAFASILLVGPVVVLLGIRGVSGPRVFFRDAEAGKQAWQFGTRRLLLVTAEVALLLALARVVLPENLKTEEIRSAFFGFSALELIPAVLGITILPILFLALTRQKSWRQFLAMGLYFLLVSAILAWVEFLVLADVYGLNWPIHWWPAVGLMFIELLVRHLSAAATILLTFYLLRRIGYDFRRRDEGPFPRGRSSSNARNSAASASA